MAENAIQSFETDLFDKYADIIEKSSDDAIELVKKTPLIKLEMDKIPEKEKEDVLIIQWFFEKCKIRDNVISALINKENDLTTNFESFLGEMGALVEIVKSELIQKEAQIQQITEISNQNQEASEAALESLKREMTAQSVSFAQEKDILNQAQASKLQEAQATSVAALSNARAENATAIAEIKREAAKNLETQRSTFDSEKQTYETAAQQALEAQKAYYEAELRSKDAIISAKLTALAAQEEQLTIKSTELSGLSSRLKLSLEKNEDSTEVSRNEVTRKKITRPNTQSSQPVTDTNAVESAAPVSGTNSGGSKKKKTLKNKRKNNRK